MSTLQDFSTTKPTSNDEPEMCEHDRRTLDEDPFTCFRCWMTAQGSELFTEGSA